MKHDVSHFQKILVIDTTDREQLNVALVMGGKVFKHSQKARAQQLQRVIDELSDEQKITVKDFDAIAVLQGPGSYTGTRIGIATANTYGWLFKLPIIELPGSSFEESLSQLQAQAQFSVTKQATALY